MRRAIREFLLELFTPRHVDCQEFRDSYKIMQ